jgi:hypothetical protein
VSGQLFAYFYEKKEYNTELQKKMRWSKGINHYYSNRTPKIQSHFEVQVGIKMKNNLRSLISVFFAISVIPVPTGASQNQQAEVQGKTPILENRTTAVEATLIDKQSRLILVLKNLTNKNIITVGTSGSMKGISFDRRHGGKPEKIFLTPGESIRTEPYPEMLISRSLLAGVAESGTLKLIINQILFDDLTFEGDKDDHLQTVGQWLGDKLQSDKIVAHFREISENFSGETNTQLSILKERVMGLAEKPLASETADLEKRLPPLGEKEINDFRTYIGRLMSYRKKQALNLIRDFEASPSKTSGNLKLWIDSHIFELTERVKAISVLL